MSTRGVVTEDDRPARAEDPEPGEAEYEARRLEEARRGAEYTRLYAQAVAACVRRGCTQEEAEAVIRDTVEEIGAEARRKHYTLGESHESVDRWYEVQFRELAAG